MPSSPPLTRPNRIALLVFLPLSLLMHLATIILRIVLTADSWDVIGRYQNEYYGRRTARGRPYQVAAIIIESLLFPVLLWQLLRLIKKRLTALEFLCYSVGCLAYWTLIMGVTIAIMTDVYESMLYYGLFYIIFISMLMGLYFIQMCWAIGVFVHGKKQRNLAPTIPGGDSGARRSYDVYLSEMGPDGHKKSTSTEV
ncbi:hypothetical protein CAC42_3526 [Sphaceloma murrayae]|uniref:Uncharacterized protein n=1 Tax=Sphaceloma murrayae TaxID=2082308 RepID=A0A2K1R1M3_9PEZI|nr:hypothetical protein CAC42_3526 [Sphaceloma murrayae]